MKDSMRKGGSFLIEEHPAAEVFTPADLTEEHRAIARTAREFFDREVAPNAEAIQHGDLDLAVTVLRKAASLGLEAVLTPERFGGMEMDMTSVMVVAEQIAGDGSFAAWHGAHAGIGTLPLLLFGTEEQKQKYLPQAFLLRIRRRLLPHRTADRIRRDGDQDASRSFAGWPVLRAERPENVDYEWRQGRLLYGLCQNRWRAVFRFLSGAHVRWCFQRRGRKKMGIKGSSTTPVFFDNVQVPVANLLGEAGPRAHYRVQHPEYRQAKAGALCCGRRETVLTVSLAYAKQRKAFGHEIAHFGMIQHKLAEMAIRIFAAESMAYRVEGLISEHLEGFSWDEPEAAKRMMKAVEEFAAECSIVKVYGSEMLDYVVDEGVQIHGGYGYHQDYAVERAYRDSRINRIFEGTNEINRLLVTGMLLKRAQQGRLGLVKAAKGLMDEILAGPSLASASESEEQVGAQCEENRAAVTGQRIRKIRRGHGRAAGSSGRNRGCGDGSSPWNLRCCGRKKTSAGADMVAVILRDGMTRIEGFAKPVLAACGEGDVLRSKMTVLRRFAKHEPVDSIVIRHRIAERLLSCRPLCCRLSGTARNSLSRSGCRDRENRLISRASGSMPFRATPFVYNWRTMKRTRLSTNRFSQPCVIWCGKDWNWEGQSPMWTPVIYR